MIKRIVKYSLGAVILSMAFLCFSLALQPVQAEGWWDTVNNGGLKDVGSAYGASAGTPSADSDIRVVISRIIRVVLELLGLIFLVLIIVAGFKWMMAGGDEEKVTSAKKLLTNSVIGLVIILIAFSIATFIFNSLQYATTGIKPVTW